MLQYQALSTVAFWFVVLLLFLILLIVVSIFLKIALAIVKGENTELSAVFGTAFACCIIMIFFIIFFGLSTVIGIILLIAGFILCFIIIAARHDISFLKAIIATILAIIIGVLIVWAISIVFFAIL